MKNKTKEQNMKTKRYVAIHLAIVAVFAAIGMLFTGCGEESITNNYYQSDVSTYVIAEFRDTTRRIIHNTHTVSVYDMSGLMIFQDSLVRFGDTVFVYVPDGGVEIISETNYTIYETRYALRDTLVDPYSWTDARFEYQYRIGDNDRGKHVLNEM